MIIRAEATAGDTKDGTVALLITDSAILIEVQGESLAVAYYWFVSFE